MVLFPNPREAAVDNCSTAVFSAKPVPLPSLEGGEELLVPCTETAQTTGNLGLTRKSSGFPAQPHQKHSASLKRCM